MGMSMVLVGMLVLIGLECILADSQGDALYALHRNLKDPHNILQSWDPTLVNLCTWFHVTCSHSNQVIRVDLENVGLEDGLWWSLAACKTLSCLRIDWARKKIPHELSKLQNLVSLDLCNNNFTSRLVTQLVLFTEMLLLGKRLVSLLLARQFKASLWASRHSCIQDR